MSVESWLSFCIFANMGILWKHGNASFSQASTAYSPCLGDSSSENILYLIIRHNTLFASFWTSCSWQFYLQKYTILFFLFLVEMVRICLNLYVVSR